MPPSERGTVAVPENTFGDITGFQSGDATPGLYVRSGQIAGAAGAWYVSKLARRLPGRCAAPCRAVSEVAGASRGGANQTAFKARRAAQEGFVCPHTRPRKHRPRAPKRAVTMEKLVNLCKRRGIVFPASDIYGRARFDLGLRPARRRAQAQRQGGVVARDGDNAQRLSSASTAPSCSIRAPGKPRAICRISPTRWSTAKAASSASAPTTSRAADAPNVTASSPRRVASTSCSRPSWPGRGQRERRLPAPRDRARHLLELRQHHRHAARQAAVRSRANRQVVPQRDHAGNFIFRTREFEQMEMEFFIKPIRSRRRDGLTTGSSSASTGTLNMVCGASI